MYKFVLKCYAFNKQQKIYYSTQTKFSKKSINTILSRHYVYPVKLLNVYNIVKYVKGNILKCKYGHCLGLT